jgi:hypothetical protein
MTKCSEKNCKNQATVAPALFIPAMGVSIHQHTPIKMVMTVPFCNQHFKTMDIKNFMLPEGKRRITEALRAIGRADPDFERAWLKPISIESDEYRELLKASTDDSP